MKRTAIILSVLVALGAAGCPGRQTAKTVTCKGSDTMVILVQRWAENYMKEKPGIIVQVSGGGSGTGIAALINGGTDICQASRPMTDKERAQVKAKFGKEVVEIPVALDGIAIYVNEQNPISEISLPQLKAIYTGKLKNWKELGGQDAEIVIYSRENNSGTYMYFKEHVLGNTDFESGVQTLPGTAALVNAVAKDSRSIGYGGIAYVKGVKAIKVKRDDASPAVEPNMANVDNGSYPISRNLFFYTVGEAQGEVKAFIDWALGAEGQKICAEVGYYPLPKTQ
jgi:phosphate transport system substrate-binding protein